MKGIKNRKKQNFRQKNDKIRKKMKNKKRQNSRQKTKK